MARGYNSQASRRNNQSPPWLWFFAGAMVGALVASLAWIKQGGVMPQPPVAQQETRPQPAPPPSLPKVEPEPEAPKPRFDFYTVLPEQEVVIPEQEITKPAPQTATSQPPAVPPATATPQRPTAEPSGDSVFMLQMGSFRNHNDADRLKARLALLGIQADIQSVTVSGPSGQNTVHRVRGGPYSRSQAQGLHETLKGGGINSIFIRIQQ